MNKRVKPHLKSTCDSWKIYKTYVNIKDIWHYLYRAIDKEGNTLDWMLSKNRNKQAAKLFFKKLVSNGYTVNPGLLALIKVQPFHLHLMS